METKIFDLEIKTRIMTSLDKENGILATNIIDCFSTDNLNLLCGDNYKVVHNIRNIYQHN